MREYWGGSARMAAALVAVAMALGAPGTALAAPGTADLVVWGPLAADGPVDVQAMAAQLLLREPGGEGYEALTFELRADAVDLSHLTVEEQCILPDDAPMPGALPRVARHALPPSSVRPLALPEDLPSSGLDDGTRDRVLDALASAPVPEPVAATVDAAAQQARTTTLSVHGDDLVRPTSAGGAAGEERVGPCFEWQPAREEERLELTDVTLTLRAVDPFYTVFWDGHDDSMWQAYRTAEQREAAEAAGEEPDEDDPSHGHSTAHGGPDHTSADMVPLLGDGRMHATDLATALQEMYEPVHMLAPEEQPAFSQGQLPSPMLAKGLVRHTARDATGGFAGQGALTVYRVEVTLHGVDAQGEPVDRVFQTGETRDSAVAGHERRVLRFLELEAEGAQATWHTPDTAQLLGGETTTSVNGGVAMSHASGSLVVDGQHHDVDGGAFALQGQFSYVLRQVHEDAAPEDEDGEERSDAMTMRVQGDLRYATANAPQVAPGPLPGVAETAAAVSIAAVVGGLLAYFWPMLKFLAAPLYTRIPKDAVLMHDARENIYRLIREEPGIHAHEIASRLGLGWGTTVYHLKLLEKNSLVLPRHEGRYKRFFATGDQRIQHKEAVALLRNPNSKRIASMVAHQPGVIQKEVCQALGVSPSLASWHLQRLADAGLVNAQRIGRAVRYEPGPAWSALHTIEAAENQATAQVA